MLSNLEQLQLFLWICHLYFVIHSRRQREHRRYLFKWQQHELLGLGHLHKVLQDILVCWFEQVAAGVRVSEASDAQAVGGVQLAEEELTTGVPHPVELQQARCREQRLEKSAITGGQTLSQCNEWAVLTILSINLKSYLHVAFSDHYLCCVGILDQLLQSLTVNVMKGHMGLPTLRHLVYITAQNESCYSVNYYYSSGQYSCLPVQSCWHSFLTSTAPLLKSVAVV